MPKTTACYLHLANGWTARISADDTPPALCSVAASPNQDLVSDRI